MSFKFGNWQSFLDVQTNIFNDLQTFSDSTDHDKLIQLLKKKDILGKSPWTSTYFKEIHNGQLDRDKCNKKASDFRNYGNQLFKRKKYIEALQEYDKCILHAKQISTPGETESDVCLGYGNRSAVYFRSGKYHECLADIVAASNCGYPKELQCKILLRKAQCFTRLGDKKAAELGIQESRTALKFVDKSKQESTEKDIIAAEKELKSLPDVLESGKVDITIPHLAQGSSSVIIQASNSLELKNSTDQGRHLVANEHIKAGDVLIVEKPYAAVLLPPHYETHCHHCFTKLTVFYPCVQCTAVRYCSETCQSQSWEMYHNIECPYLDLLHSIGIAHLSLRVVLTAGLQQLLDFRKTQSTCDSEGGIPGVTNRGTYERNYLSVFSLMPHSEHMAPEDLFQYSLTAVLLLELLENCNYFSNTESAQDTSSVHARCNVKSKHNLDNTCIRSDNVVNHDCTELTNTINRAFDSNETSQFLKAKVNSTVEQEVRDTEIKIVDDKSKYCDKNTNQKLVEISEKSLGESNKITEAVDKMDNLQVNIDSVDQVKMYIGGLLLRHICQLVCNAHAITELQLSETIDMSTVATQTQERIATAIYPTTSLLNHSCQPTIINSFMKDMLVVRAVRDVAAGEQVYNCYGPHAQRMSYRERQMSLKSQYFFTCRCTACLTEGQMDAIYTAFKCPSCCGPLVNDSNIKSTDKSGEGSNSDCSCTECKHKTKGENLVGKSSKAISMFENAVMLMDKGNIEESLHLLQQAVKLQDDVLYKYNRDRAQTHDAIAKCFSVLGKYSEAVPHLRESLDTTRFIYGQKSIEVASELQKYSEVLLHARHKTACIQAAEEAKQLFELHYGKDDHNQEELEKLICVAKYSL